MKQMLMFNMDIQKIADEIAKTEECFDFLYSKEITPARYACWCQIKVQADFIAGEYLAQERIDPREDERMQF